MKGNKRYHMAFNRMFSESYELLFPLRAKDSAQSGRCS